MKRAIPGVVPGIFNLNMYIYTIKIYVMAKAKSHPGFKAVQNKIASKEGVSKKSAGAILASASRKASSKAKAANPRLRKVK